jgi:hypothetical protein
MFLHNDKYLCVRCGVEIDITPEQRSLVMMATSGGSPNMRVISLDGRELHACPADRAWEKRAGQ